jgi:Mg/Co/Ni transporter MgtE
VQILKVFKIASSALSGVHLRDIINTRFVSVRPDITVKELLNITSRYIEKAIPITTYDGFLLGAVTTKHVMSLLER